MKVLYVVQNRAPFSGSQGIGGRTAHIIGVVEALQRLGHEVVFQAFEPLPYISPSAVRFRPLIPRGGPVPRVRGILQQWSTVSQVIRAVAEERPGMLYIRWARNVFVERIRRAYPDLPIVLECNSTARMNLGGAARPGVLRRWVDHWSDRANARIATVVSAVSEETRDFLLRDHPYLDLRRVIVNPNGVDTDRFRPLASQVREEYGIPGEAVLVGYAGYFVPWHRVDLMIEAFHRLGRDDMYLLILGTGPEELVLKLRRLAEGPCADRIVFAGPVPFDRMPEHLSACDILVSPQSATVEGRLHQSPIKLFEYMAVARAVIGARIGQIADIIDDGVNGILFEPDDVESLAAAIGRLADDPGLRARLGAEARHSVMRDYSWDANVRRILGAVEGAMEVAAGHLPGAGGRR